jgi:aryl-alcohol dehydrogenase-like predicted oxidoreductase
MKASWKAPQNLSRFAFGVSGPHATPFVAREQTQALILAAFHGGITAFDTGPSYGAGEAEKRLGAALKQLPRDKVFVSTKAGVNEQKQRDFSVSAIKASLDRSLDRLGCDYVDALILHGPAALEMTPEFADALIEEKQKGRVRALGVAGRDHSITNAVELGVFDLLMAPFHAGLTPTEKNRLVAAQDAGLGIMAIEVLNGANQGLRWPRSMADLWYSLRAVRYRKLAAPTQRAGEALRFALNSELSDVVMLTTTRLAHLNEALDVLDEVQSNT